MRIVSVEHVEQNPARDGQASLRPILAVGQIHPRDGLRRRMGMAAKARFAAHKRLEAKGVATNAGLQLASFMTIAIGVLVLQFSASEALKPYNGVLNYMSLIASVFVQIMALVETMKDYPEKARQMHVCAVAISSLQQRFEIDPRTDWQTLEGYRAAYEAVIKDANLNHDAIDYRRAQLEPDKIRPRSRQERFAIARWRLAYLWNVYGLTVTILVSPWLAGWGLIRLGLT
jgi:SMODS and SLOG-associating 2TM effector domain family 5